MGSDYAILREQYEQELANRQSQERLREEEHAKLDRANARIRR
jgi:hypothetical protein|eukprot:COSAG01_NODE_3532_length_5963_cov_21.070771_7_plen_43_part_00